jgi:hypothetical protein
VQDGGTRAGGVGVLEGGEESYSVCGERVCHILGNALRYGLTLHRLKDINENCLREFREHWGCLEQNNQQMWNCRQRERKLNKCIFDKLVCFPRPSQDIYGTGRLES